MSSIHTDILNKLLKAEDLVAMDLVRYLTHYSRYFTRELPTEMVLRSHDDVDSMDIARAHRIERYVEGDQIVTYNEIRKRPDFKGTSAFPEVVLAEVWIDRGDDGSTRYDHEGWTLMLAKQWEELAGKEVSGGIWPSDDTLAKSIYPS